MRKLLENNFRRDLETWSYLSTEWCTLLLLPSPFSLSLLSPSSHSFLSLTKLSHSFNFETHLCLSRQLSRHVSSSTSSQRWFASSRRCTSTSSRSSKPSRSGSNSSSFWSPTCDSWTRRTQEGSHCKYRLLSSLGCHYDLGCREFSPSLSSLNILGSKLTLQSPLA